MGNGASSPSRHGSGGHSPARPASAAATTGPRTKKLLVNAASRASAGSFLSPAATTAATVNRQANATNAQTRSAALQHVAVQRRQRMQGANGSSKGGHAGDEDAMLAFTRNADPVSLRVLDLIQQSDAAPAGNPTAKLRLLRQCYPLLETVPTERFDQLAVTVYQKEADVYYQQEDTENAKDAYSRAITLAEKRVARQETDMYMVLKRYVLSMVGMARIWYDHERDYKGFVFVDYRHPQVQAADGTGDGAATDASLSSIESTVTSGAGSVFSLNEAILRSMAPRPPRRQTGPTFQRLKMQAPHVTATSQFTREDEFVLHSRMTRELVASPCELLLLRCCEVVQIGHNSQSELLIPAQIELAQIYEDLALYSRALLLVRRCLGILCSVYDYDHPWVVQLMQRADRLKGLLEEQRRHDSATKIQATWKMHRAMLQLEDAIGHPVQRHQWIPRKFRATPELDFLGDFVGDMPANGQLGDDVDDGEYSAPTADESVRDSEELALVPHAAPVQEAQLRAVYPIEAPARVSEEREQPVGQDGLGALVRYAPVEREEGGDVFTTMVQNATVVGTTQDTQTDTDVQHTEYGDVLTVRTTTVTKTITEDLVDSGEDDADEESLAGERSPYDDARGPGEVPYPAQQPPRNTAAAPAHPPPPQRQPSPYYDEEEDEPALEASSPPECAPTEHQQSLRAPPVGQRRAPQKRSTGAAAPPPPPQARPRPERHAMPAHDEPDQAAALSLWQPQRGSHGGASHDGQGVNEDSGLVATFPKPVRHPSRDGVPAPARELADSRQRRPYEDDPQDTAPYDAASVPSRSYMPGVQHNSRRESLHDLVDPTADYPREANGCPAFFPPLNHRVSSGSANAPYAAEAGHLAVRAPANGVVQLYNGHGAHTGANPPGRQPGMPMSQPSPSNGYAPQLPNVGPQQQQQQPPQRTTKTTRDYRIVKTRRVRTYVHERVSDGEEGSLGTGSSSGVPEPMSSPEWEPDSDSVSYDEVLEEYEDEGNGGDVDGASSRPSTASSPQHQQPRTTQRHSSSHRHHHRLQHVDKANVDVNGATQRLAKQRVPTQHRNGNGVDIS